MDNTKIKDYRAYRASQEGTGKPNGKVESLPEIYKEYPQLEKYNIADLAIEEMSKKFLHLKIADIKDTAGYEMVRLALSEVRSKRILVEKKRKELKEDALRFGRVVDGEAKRITGLLIPLESHLESEKNRIDAEVENIKLEKERIAKVRVDNMSERLLEIGMNYNPVRKEYYYKERKVTETQLSSINDETFEIAFADVKEMIDADKKLTELKEIEAREQAEKLRIEKEALEKQRLEQEEKQKLIDIDREIIRKQKEKIQQEKDQKELEERLRKEAEEKAQLKVENDLKAEAERKRLAEYDLKVKKHEEERERKRLKELQPDKMKIENYIEELRNVNSPQLKTGKADKILADMEKELKVLFDKVLTQTKNLK